MFELVYTNIWLLLLAILIVIVISLFAYYKKSLSKSGMITAIFIGIIISLFGGFYFIGVLLTFFISSSLISRVIGAEKKDSLRNYKQVLANGGVATVLVLLYNINPEGPYQLLFVISFAVATADTWAGEIGRLSKKQPKDIITLKEVPIGLSGGVTSLGFLASLLGSITISIWALFSPLVILFGFLGSVIDSILGHFQVKYMIGDIMVDDPSDETVRLTKGFTWLTNNLVNLLSNIITIGIAYIIL